MRFLIPGLFALVTAVVLGFGSAGVALGLISQGAAISNGPWQTNALIGSKGADMYTRAGVAIAGLFALTRSEAVYFTAGKDNEGNPLNAGCVYRVEGTDMPARWWSITVYGTDYFLIPNEANRYSMTRGGLLDTAGPDEINTDAAMSVPDAPESFAFTAARAPQLEPWLPLGEAESFSLTLRLYGLPADLTDEDNLKADLAGLDLPTITRESCS